MKLHSIFTIILLSLILSYKGYCQSESKSKAEHALRHSNFPLALNYYQLYDGISKDPESLMNQAIAKINQNQISEAIEDLTLAKSQAYNNVDLYWYMGQCKHFLNQWYEAISFYKKYIENSSEGDKFYSASLIEIKNCLYSSSQDRSIDKSNTLVQSFGPEINSVYDEIYPVQSPSYGNVFYYSSNNTSEAFKIYASQISNDGEWIDLDIISRPFNMSKYNLIQDIDIKGQTLLYLEQQETTKLVFITIDSLGNEIKIPVPLENLVDGIDFHIVNKNTLAFASKQKGGFGGYDIYYWEYRSKKWLAPVNAGSLVNSPYDERSPFVNEDKSKVYYSSNRPYGYGGYDIYLSDIKTKDPISVNMGSAINSSSNDIHFKLDDDGHMGMFSSDRKTGIGGYDLYFLYLQNFDFSVARDSSSFEFVIDRLNENDYRALVDLNVKKDKLDTIPANDELSLAIKESIQYPYNLFYRDSHDLLHGENARKLERLTKDALVQDFHISIIAHSYNEPGLEEYVQYNTLRRALLVSEFLVEEGINTERISIESVADNYPLVKSPISSDKLASLSHYNKRLDIILYDNNSKIINDSLAMNWSMIPDFALDDKYALYRLIKEGLYYSVQIARSDRLFKNALLRLYHDVFIRKEALDSTNDYYIGLYTKLEDAKVLLEDIKKSKSLSPKIQAFYNGKPLTDKQIRIMALKYRELNYFIKDR